MIDSSKQIAKAAGMVGTLRPDSPAETVVITISSALAQMKSASQGIEVVVEQCSLARGMYLNSTAIRNTLINAGEYLQARQPRISEAIYELEDIKANPSSHRAWSEIVASLTELAISIASVQFDPSVTTSLSI